MLNIIHFKLSQDALFQDLAGSDWSVLAHFMIPSEG